MVAVNVRAIANPPATALLAAQGGGCFYCGVRISLAGFDRKGNRTVRESSTATKDHLFPHLAGRGARLWLNKVFACSSCNGRKGCNEPAPLDIEKARNLYRNLGAPWFGIG